jgi:hypothetical protein
MWRMPPARRLLPTAGATLLVAGMLLSRPVPAGAAEITVFVSGASPGEVWGSGFGGMLTITLFGVVGAEVEGARQSGEPGTGSLWTLSGKAYVGPSFGRLVPYVGIGAGVYLESLPVDDDRGTIGSVFVGAKLKFPFGLVVRGEYQWLTLPDAAPLPMDQRYFVGLGLGF